MDEQLSPQEPIVPELAPAPTPPPIPDESFWKRWKGILIPLMILAFLLFFGFLTYRVTVYLGKIQRGEVIDISAFSNNDSASQLSEGNTLQLQTINNEAVNNFGDDPSFGPENADITVVMFEDFECPYCGKAFPVISSMREQFGDSVRFIYRDFPITAIHANAQKAAEAGQCAYAQGKFWEYHDLLFKNQTKLTVADLKSHASKLGLDTDQFNTCLDTGEYADEVQQDFEDGVRAGVSGTPTFFFNGNPVKGVLTQNAFVQVISVLRSQSTNTSTQANLSLY